MLKFKRWFAVLLIVCMVLPAVTVFALTDDGSKAADASMADPVTVGIITSSAPVCYLDERTGEFAGIFMELLDTISKKTGLCFEYVALDLQSNSPVGWLKSGEPDLVAGILMTEKFMNDPELVLSDVLVNDNIVVVGRKGDDFTQQPSERTIAVPAGFQVALEYVEAQFPNHSVATFPTVTDCLNAVADGRVDATLYMRSCLSYLLQNPHYEKLEIVPAFLKNIDTCIAGLSADKTELMATINDGLGKITQDERNAIMMDYTIVHPYQMTLDDIVYKYRVPLLIIAALVIAVAVVLIVLGAVRRRTAKQLKLLYEQETAALQLAKEASAAKGNFMSRMSHEIRTPLNAVIGYNTIARRELSAAETDADIRQANMKVMDYLIKSDSASKHLLAVINDVLDMSAIESGKIKAERQRFDFKAMITNLTTMFYSQARAKGVELEVMLDALMEEWFIGDQTRVNQVLTNLLSNAVKFTMQGGRVRFTISQPELLERSVCIHFEVADTGIGMDAEYLKYIWTPFEQADKSISRRFGGTGLGMSITKSLVDIMGGSISVESEKNVGTTFRVDLMFERTDQPVESKRCDFSKVNALIVDDDSDICDYMKLLFERFGARSTAVCSGEEALTAITDAIDAGDAYTLCLLDWCMPGMDGIETVRRMRDIAGADLPMMVITAYDFSEMAAAARDAGVTRLLAKPLFPSSLFDMLADICGSVPVKREDASSSYDFGGARVLLAEDNRMNMEVAKRILQSVGIVVDSAWNGLEAVTMFDASPAGTYRAILMDIQMPELDGYEAARIIRALSHPDAATVPIIAMTADAFAENVVEALEAGMDDHIAKPIDLAILFGTLSQYIK